MNEPCAQINSKNLLQEICQKNKKPLPVYTTIKSHDSFLSTVKVTYNGSDYEATGEERTRKTDAEISVAQAMLVILKSLREQQIQTFTAYRDVYVLIDIENIHVGDFFEHYQFNDKYYFMGFATENHPAITVCSSLVKIETIKSSQKDAADVLLIYYASQISNYAKIIIVTKDHFGQTFADLINSKSESHLCQTVKSLSDLILQIQK